MIRAPIEDRGHGEPPMLLVGGGLTGWLSWERAQAQLAAERRVLRAQLVGVQAGLDGAPLPADYSVRLESQAIGAALDAVAPGPAVDLVAWSYGGLVSLDLALERPERVRTLTLIEP